MQNRIGASFAEQSRIFGLKTNSER